MWNLSTIFKTILISDEVCLKWCQNIGLIKDVMKCPECDNEMRLYYKENQWRCYLSSHKRIKISIRANTWFENSKLSFDKIIILSYIFANGNTKYSDIIRELSNDKTIVGMHTVSDWLSYCREVCVLALDKYYDIQGKIGGDGHIVQIDETKIGKRKYNRGRSVEGSWVIGMLDLGNLTEKRCDLRLEICPQNKRDSETLVKLITKHEKLGTTIYTDQWKSYDCLTKYGYKHETVNHSENFVNPENGVHTQNIECEWRQLKRKLHSGGHHQDLLADYMCEYLWRRIVKFENKDPFIEFISAVCDIYKA